MASTERRLALLRELLDSEGDPHKGDAARIARALVKGYVTPDHLRQCRAEIEGKVLGIVDCLLQKGYLTIEEYLDLDAAESEPPVATERIGKYRLIRLIGRGGMGEVYEAEDEDLKRRVALKTTREDAPDAELVQRMRREAAIAARLRHPNIVEVFDFGTAKDSRGKDLHFIAMEYVSGKTLATLLAERTLPRRARLEVLVHVAQAVGFAHSQGVLHRDLKPENVLIDEAGRVVLTDFGLAKSADLFHSRLTQSQTLLGTPQYMAPEQVAGKVHQISAPSDVYALGVMMYEILAGRPPFSGDTPATLYSKILNEEPAGLRKIDPTIERDLETICSKAMAKERRKRYVNGNEFALELGRFLMGEPISARPTGLPTRLWRRLKKRRAVVLPIAAVLMVVSVGVGWALVAAAKKERGIRQKLDAATRCETEGSTAEARDLYRAVLDADPNRAEAKAGVDRMESALHKVALDSEDAQRLFEAGQTALDAATSGLYDKKTTPEEVLERVRQGRDWVAQGLEKAPGAARGHYLMGRLLEFDGSDEEAERSYREAIRLDSNFGVAHHFFGRLLTTRQLLANPQIGREISADEKQVSVQLSREAVDELNRARSLLAGWHDALEQEVARVMTAWSDNDTDRMKQAADAALEKHGNKHGCEDLYWLRGFSARTVEEGMEYYRRALEINPKHWRTLYARGCDFFMMGKTMGKGRAEALEDLSLLIRLRPRFVQAYDVRAEVRLALGDARGAAADAEQIMALNASGLTACAGRGHCIRGRARKSLKEWKGAFEDLSKHLELDPGCAGAIVARGQCLCGMGDLDGALRDAEEALRRQPDCYEALILRAHTHTLTKEYALAVADFAELIRLSPQEPTVYLGRGMLYQLVKDSRAAISDYEKALSLAPPDWPNRREVEDLLAKLKAMKK